MTFSTSFLIHEVAKISNTKNTSFSLKQESLEVEISWMQWLKVCNEELSLSGASSIRILKTVHFRFSILVEEMDKSDKQSQIRIVAWLKYLILYLFRIHLSDSLFKPMMAREFQDPIDIIMILLRRTYCIMR